MLKISAAGKSGHAKYAPQKCLFLWGFPGPHLKHGLLGTTRVYMPNGISLGSTVFAHTDGPGYNSSNKLLQYGQRKVALLLPPVE